MSSARVWPGFQPAFGWRGAVRASTSTRRRRRRAGVAAPISIPGSGHDRSTTAIIWSCPATTPSWHTPRDRREGRIERPDEAEFPFVDLEPASAGPCGREGRSRGGYFDKPARAGTRRSAITCALARIDWAAADKPIGDVIPCEGRCGTPDEPVPARGAEHRPRDGSAVLAGAVILRETLAKGGQACRPSLPRDRLGRVRRAGDAACRPRRIRCGRGLAASACGSMAACRRSNSQRIRSRLVAMTRSCWRCRPGWRRHCCQDCSAPTDFRAIVNAHFEIDCAGTRAADAGRHRRYGGMDICLSRPHFDHDQRRRTDWSTCRARSCAASGRTSQVAGLTADDVPTWQIVQERRATFAATPGAGRQAPGRGNAMVQPVPCRRLDRDRPARDHRKRRPLRPQSGGFGDSDRERRMIAFAGDPVPPKETQTGLAIRGATRALLDLPAAQTAIGFRTRSRRHDPGRICAARAFSRRDAES